ncbi:hypothetical protein ACLMAL_26965 [Nocardia sp. CWNU-33]|uniref:hypothetical protein n=1 Tax=Nocardia sp. CWNU-33 TaxID=3392117 RepID=UPI00398EDD8B
MRQLESARDAATTDVAAAGIAASDIQLAVEQGRAGAYWIDRPAHRYLGRIAQLTDEIAGKLCELDAYRQQITELEHRPSQARDNAPTGTHPRKRKRRRPFRGGAVWSASQRIT